MVINNRSSDAIIPMHRSSLSSSLSSNVSPVTMACEEIMSNVGGEINTKTNRDHLDDYFMVMVLCVGGLL